MDLDSGGYDTINVYVLILMFQIDSSSPKVKISLLNETSETGTPLISFHKTDIGSGVRNVDLYIANGMVQLYWNKHIRFLIIYLLINDCKGREAKIALLHLI